MKAGRHFPSYLLEDGLTQDFFNRRDPLLDLLEAAHAQGQHTLLEGLSLDLARGRSHHDEVADPFRDLHDLVETDAPLVSRTVAGPAAAPLVHLERADLIRREADVDQGLGRDVLELFLAPAADAAD